MERAYPFIISIENIWNYEEIDKKGGGASLGLGKEQIILLCNKILIGDKLNRLNLKKLFLI